MKDGAREARRAVGSPSAPIALRVGDTSRLEGLPWESKSLIESLSSSLYSCSSFIDGSPSAGGPAAPVLRRARRFGIGFPARRICSGGMFLRRAEVPGEPPPPAATKIVLNIHVENNF